ncbi:MAG: crotonase [Gammaproteobacteria bacterium]|nr:MAG: crotonase [Gammaproteobacteria bacterium]
MKFFKLEKKNNIAIISFTRAKSLNALNQSTLKELIDLNRKIQSDTTIKAVIYRAEGIHFSAGADIKEKPKASSKIKTWKTNLGKEAIESILKLDQITLASLKGYCLGGAACIATACDFRIASLETTVAYPEIDLGMNLNWLGLPLLLRLIGPARTKKMVISGEAEDATTLFDWGFIDKICETGDLDKTTLKFAKKFTSKDTVPAQMIKRSINALTYQNDQAIMHMDYDQFLLTKEFLKK